MWYISCLNVRLSKDFWLYLTRYYKVILGTILLWYISRILTNHRSEISELYRTLVLEVRMSISVYHTQVILQIYNLVDILPLVIKIIQLSLYQELKLATTLSSLNFNPKLQIEHQLLKENQLLEITSIYFRSHPHGWNLLILDILLSEVMSLF